MPACEKDAVVSTAAVLPNVTVPGPDIWDHVVVTCPGEVGSPSSLTVPSRLADDGSTMLWSGPAFTFGASLVGPPPIGGREAVTS